MLRKCDILCSGFSLDVVLKCIFFNDVGKNNAAIKNDIGEFSGQNSSRKVSRYKVPMIAHQMFRCFSNHFMTKGFRITT